MKANNPFYAEQQPNPDDARVGPSFQGGWLYGTVLAVEPSSDLLFLHTQESRKREVIRLASATRYAVSGHPSASNDLHSGLRVRIHCRFVNDELVTDTIGIDPENYPGGSKPQLAALHPKPGLNRVSKAL